MTKVQEIHHNFRTISFQYSDVTSKIENLEKLLEIEKIKVSKLNLLGFNNTIHHKNILDYKNQIYWLKLNHEAFVYFNSKYPLHKFITFKNIIDLSNKYNLDLGDFSQYIGEVPDKNIEEINSFKIDEIDTGFEVGIYFQRNGVKKYNTAEEINTLLNTDYKDYRNTPHKLATKLPKFQIVASHHLMSKSDKKDIDDPIVVSPVLYKSNLFYIIVTAWGDEAKNVANPIYN